MFLVLFVAAFALQVLAYLAYKFIAARVAAVQLAADVKATRRARVASGFVARFDRLGE